MPIENVPLCNQGSSGSSVPDESLDLSNGLRTLQAKSGVRARPHTPSAYERAVQKFLEGATLAGWSFTQPRRTVLHGGILVFRRSAKCWPCAKVDLSQNQFKYSEHLFLVPRRGPPARAAGVQHMGELGSKEKNHRRIVNPNNDHDQRSGSAIG